MTQLSPTGPDPNVRVTPEIYTWMMDLPPKERAELRARLTQLTEPTSRKHMPIRTSDVDPAFHRVFLDNNVSVLFKFLEPGDLPGGEEIEPGHTILVAGIDQGKSSRLRRPWLCVVCL